MTNEQIGALLEAFANYYWSLPVSYVTGKIMEWHPEVSSQQIEEVMKMCDHDVFWHHCCIEMIEDAPELVVEHLVAIDYEDLKRFIAARPDGPYCDCDEETLLRYDTRIYDFPEAKAIMDWGKSELGIDDGLAKQLVSDCVFEQPNALCEKRSWVEIILQAEKFGQIHFQTIEQIKQFRELGTKLYHVLPNPVLKGFKPSQVENPPTLLDDIPEREEDIPDARAAVAELRATFNKYMKKMSNIEKAGGQTRSSLKANKKKKKKKKK